MELKLSLYKHGHDNKGIGNYPILDIIEGIKTSQRYKKATDGLRALLDSAPTPTNTEESKKEIKAFKATVRDYKEYKFKGVTWSGLFHERNGNSLVTHSGLMCIDIDKIFDEDKLNALRFKILQDPFVFILFVSPSGNGLKVVCKTDCKDAEKHKEYYEMLHKYFVDTYGISKEIDAKCKNVDRLCFLPYDENIQYFEDSAPFRLEHKSLIISGQSSELIDSDEQIKHCISEIKDRGIDVTADYDTWCKIGFAFASLGETGRDYFHEVSAIYPGYTPTETDKKFDNFLQSRSGNVNIQTFFYVCKEAGIKLTSSAVLSPEKIREREAFREIYAEAHTYNRQGKTISELEATFKFLEKTLLIHPDRIKKAFEKVYSEHKEEFDLDSKPEIYKVEAFLKDRFDFARNEITQAEEFRPRGQKEYETINNDTLYRLLQRNHFKFSLDKIKSLIRSDFVPTINPFKEYFYSLPKWSGQTDFIDKLASYIDTDDNEFWRAMFKKALVRSIACAVGGRENRIVMVFVQDKQNTGKSNFIKFLNPFGQKYYTDSPIRDNKDVEIRLSENFIYNLEELDGLKALDAAKLKAIISKSIIKERKAYKADEKEAPRRCSFWGSTNNAEFLTDSENTRWLCFNVLNVSHEYHNKDTGVINVDINDVWAQAFHLYQNGFNYQLTPEESAKRDLSNKNYEVGSSEKDLLIEFFEQGTEKDLWYSLATLEFELSKKTENKININRYSLGRALKALGFKQASRYASNNVKTRGYFVKEVFKQPGATPVNMLVENMNPAKAKQVQIFTDDDDDETPF